MAKSITTVGRTGMGGFRIRVDFSQIKRNITKLHRELSDRREVLHDIAYKYMARKVIRRRFVAQGIPRWKKLAPSTIRRRRWKSKPILVQTGMLKRSATGGAGWVEVFYPASHPRNVEFGSSIDYASDHDHPRGTKVGNIPGRPWSELTQENVNTMRDMMVTWVEKKIRKVGATP